METVCNCITDGNKCVQNGHDSGSSGNKAVCGDVAFLTKSVTQLNITAYRGNSFLSNLCVSVSAAKNMCIRGNVAFNMGCGRVRYRVNKRVEEEEK